MTSFLIFISFVIAALGAISFFPMLLFYAMRKSENKSNDIAGVLCGFFVFLIGAFLVLSSIMGGMSGHTPGSTSKKLNAMLFAGSITIYLANLVMHKISNRAVPQNGS